MGKRVISVLVLLCLFLSTFLFVPVYAGGAIALNKTVFTAGEKGQATVSGLSEEAIGDGAFLAIVAKDTKPENAPVDMYVSDLPTSSIWEFTAPLTVGAYEIMLLDLDYNLIYKAAFTVGAPGAKDGDITLSKKEVKLNEPMTVTVKGLTDEQVDNDAWLGIEKYDVKLMNTVVDVYIRDLPVNNTYSFTAPDHFGKYEVRVFSDGNGDYEAAFFGKQEFAVVSSKAKPGDITLSKTSVRPEEKLSVAVKGLTQGEIAAEAWIGIAMSGEKLKNTVVDEYISSLPINNTYEFTAPSQPGTYEVRVFCAYNMSAEEEYEYGMFGKAEFIVSGEAEPAGEFSAGYEGLSGWAAGEVNEALTEGLTTDKILSAFPSDITREEFCELAVVFYEKMSGEKAVPAAVNPFSDTKNPEVLKAYNLKIVSGVGDGKFAPDNKVTRQEISAMLVRALKAVMPNLDTKAEFTTKFEDSKDISSWALDSVKFLNKNKIVMGTTLTNGTSYILPKGNTTREQAILLVKRLFDAFYKI